ncbi:MAG: hypothetical protein IJ877_01765 [Candidatus Gastranaerophilales bacterium]|nr:hypothetical protein [Candidatus Gastranaerophilales bacterium]
MASKELTKGNPLKLIICFMIPIFSGNLFQLFYNFIDALIVGRFIGIDALASVGASGAFVLFLGYKISLAKNFKKLKN